MRIILSALAAVLFLPCCKDHPQSSSADDFSIIPMKEYKYDSADIKSGTPIGILAFSGSKTNEGSSVYYPQFIVVNRMTGDTLRILTALIAVDSVPGSDPEVFTSPTQFDGNAHVLDAVFEKLSSEQDDIMEVMTTSIKNDDDVKKANRALQEPRQDFVLVNKAAPVFMCPYKTAVGVLRFHKQPW